AIAFSNHSTTAASVTNAAFIDGKAALNVATNNVTKVADKAALLAAVSAYPVSSDGDRFVEDVTGINDGYPILAREVQIHENVKDYACGRRVCLDCNKILTKASEEKHTYREEATAPDGYVDGVITATCTACGAMETKAGTASVHRPTVKDGAYEIATVDHLKWYQQNLEAGRLNGRESLVLVEDIDCKNETLVPIGSAERPFGGKLDGALHTISNYTINASADGGLFGKLTMGASITKLMLSGVTVEAEGAAGALFGTVATGAIAKIEWVAVANSTVTSRTSAAGAIGGTTNTASEIALSQCVASKATVSGKYAGGLIGNGNATSMKNCYVDATVEGTTSDGSLAYYVSGFHQENCGYVRNAATNRTDGRQISKDGFASGEAAYLINAYSNQRIFGCENGVVGFGNPTYRVCYGEEAVYTSLLLSDTGDLEVYTDGKTVAIVVKRESGPRLTDGAIKLTAGGKTVEVKLGDLTLTRRVTLNGKTVTVADESALYILSLGDVSAYEIGSLKGSAVRYQ
ncbi:MAG: hypothetical protein IJW46_07050, partial [Clostridia bacterium]|nr:hypothetical protein [Clostridia bacterium]